MYYVSHLRHFRASSRTFSHYDTLGVASNASTKEIKKAYFELSKRFHPDSASGGHERRFREVVEAYSVLGNEQKRRIYDEKIQYGLGVESQRVSR